MNHQSKLIVIFDGECNFCQQVINWIENQITITAIPYQTAQLEQFDLTALQVSQRVYVIVDQVKYSGAAAVAFLLRSCGYKYLSFVIKASGPLGEFGYNWVASHRSSFLVRLLAKFFEIKSD